MMYWRVGRFGSLGPQIGVRPFFVACVNLLTWWRDAPYIKKELNKDLDSFIGRKMDGIKLLTSHIKQDITQKLGKGNDR
jgi:hypothetical protein